jgi:hypothetical protein
MKNLFNHTQKIIAGIFIALWLLLNSASAKADEKIILSSTERQTTLMELYVSQGCSSCPPAQDWLNGFVDDPQLWKDIIPVVFHVDYWDGLGWKDPFASREFTHRQRHYKAADRIASIYTPGFVVNGKEWRGWFEQQAFQPQGMKAGQLIAQVQSGRLEVFYETTPETLFLNVALLGFDLKTQVTRGENRNRELKEHFVVLAHETHVSGNGHWSVAIPGIPIKGEGRHALALWISREGDLTPLQATGGWISE